MRSSEFRFRFFIFLLRRRRHRSHRSRLQCRTLKTFAYLYLIWSLHAPVFCFAFNKNKKIAQSLYFVPKPQQRKFAAISTIFFSLFGCMLYQIFNTFFYLIKKKLIMLSTLFNELTYSSNYTCYFMQILRVFFLEHSTTGHRCAFLIFILAH